MTTDLALIYTAIRSTGQPPKESPFSSAGAGAPVVPSPPPIVASSDILTAVAPQPSLGSFQFDRKIGSSFLDLRELYRKPEARLDQKFSDRNTSRAGAIQPDRCNRGLSGRQEAHAHSHMSNDSPRGRPPVETDNVNRSGPGTTPASRELPPLPPSERQSTAQEAQQVHPAAHGISMRPTPPPSSTPPEQRLARPIGVENLLNPSAGHDPSSGSARQYAERLNSPRMGPHLETSRAESPSAPSVTSRKQSSTDLSLPSITPPPVATHLPQPRAMTPRSPTAFGPAPMTSGIPTGIIDARQSPFVLPREQVPGGASAAPPSIASGAVASSNPQFGQPPSVPSAYSSPRLRQVASLGQIPRSQAYAPIPMSASHPPFIGSRSSSPASLAARPGTPGLANQPGRPQSFFSGPFAANAPPSTSSQDTPDKKTFGGASTPRGGQYPMMTLETESGTIQVPVDVQAASRVADEKRKRNATASHRFRQRRKEKEQETASNIANLESRVRELSEDKDYYQRERDFLQDFITRHRVPLPPRPVSPRRRRHASIGGPPITHYTEEGGGREEGRNTRRRTSAYTPPQGPPPPFERVSALPTENLQGAQQRLRPHEPYQAGPHLYGPPGPT